MHKSLKKELKNEYVYFVATRFVVVALKPFFLWFLLNNEAKESANLVSVFFLAIGSLMVLFNNEAHFTFYKVKYNSKQQKQIVLGKRYLEYIDNLLYHFAIFIIPIFILCIWLSGGIKIGVIIFIVLLLEKVIDEIQRFFQFEKLFIKWSHLMLTKSLIPILVCITVLYFYLHTEVFYLFIFTQFCINLFLIYQFTTNQVKKNAVVYVKRLTKIGFRKYLKRYFNLLFFNQLQSFSTRNIPQVDRLFVRILMPNFLAEITLIAQLCSTSILFVDYFLISNRRKEYIEKRNSVFAIVSKSKVIITFIISFLIFAVGFLILKHLDLLNEILIDQNLILLIGFSYSIYAISQHFANFNFWNVIRKKTLIIDLLFYLGVCLLLISFKSFLSYELIISLILSIFVMNFLRLIMQIKIAVSSLKN